MKPPLMMQFPSFQIDEDDFRAGNIVAKAKSPSNRVLPLTFSKDPTGGITMNLVPDEIGDWRISIWSNNKPIRGSPFTVRVYDGNQVKVYGLEGGEDGSAVSFTVDASKAGSGKLTVEVMKDNGSVIEASIKKIGKSHKVVFEPSGPGVYTVRVYYATVEVPGSPFKVTIVDTKHIVASGSGLTSAMVGKVATFRVDTGRATNTSAQVTVRVISCTGVPVAAYAKPIGAGMYEVDYIPEETGKYTVAVDYGGKAIPGSPFVVDVFSLEHVKMIALTYDVLVNKPATLELEARNCGTYDPVVRVNDGRWAVDMKKLDQGRYKASFVPKELGSCYVDVHVCGEHIPGSPFLVNVHDGSDVFTTLENVKGVVRCPLKFDIVTEPHKGEVKVQVFSPSRKNTPCRLTKVDDCFYNAEFMPNELGNYEVQVLFEGAPIRGSPFLVPMGNPGGVVLSMKNKSIILGQSFFMNADTTKAGPGDLAVRASGMDGPLPIDASLMSAGMYTIVFTPENPGQHFVEVDFDCKPLPESPISLMVYDVNDIIVTGGEFCLMRVGSSKTIQVDTSNAGVSELLAKLTSPGNTTVPLTISGNAKTGFDISVSPKDAGLHQISLTYGGVLLPSSPISFMAFDTSKIKVVGLNDGVVGRPSNFLIDLINSGEGELEVVVTSSSGKPILNEVNALSAGKLDVSFVPMERGFHCVDVTFNKEPVPGSPFKVKVLDASQIQVSGDGVEKVLVNEVALFYATGQDIKACEVYVQIQGPRSSRHIIANVTDAGPNRVKIEYVPKTVGDYQVSVEYLGSTVQGSPFEVKVWDASRVYVSRLPQAYVGAPSNFNIEMKDAGDGTVEISILDPSGQLIPNYVTSTLPGAIQVEYTPVMSGLHNVIVEFNGVRVNGTPRQMTVVDPSKVSVKGDGIGSVQCNTYTNFSVIAPDATIRDVDVKVTDPTGREVSSNVVERGGSFRVDYTPTIVGNYMIDVCVFGIPARGSPFVSSVWDHKRVVIIEQGNLPQTGCKTSFKVVVAEAGEGLCEVSITDPSGHLVPNQLFNSEAGVLDIFFTPPKHGEYRATVLFNEKFVPGSPFSFSVIDKEKVMCKLPSNGYVPVKKVASLLVTAPMAKMCDVDFQVIGPDEGEVSTNVSETGGGVFKVDFTPNVAGDYRLTMKYFACPMPLATIKAWDISKVFVGCIKAGRVGVENNFDVDLKEAGEGNFEVSIENCNHQLIENCLSEDARVKGLYHVTCVPGVASPHMVNVLFNDQHVKGSPFTMMVIDPSQVEVEGEGLHVVRCNRPTGFHITGPKALVHDVHCDIKTPSGLQLKNKVTSCSIGSFSCHYIPNETGEHLIFVKYFDEPVKDSPFMMLCWDPAKVVVECIRPSIVGRPNAFYVNVSEAGAGNLEVLMTSKGEVVKSVARSVPDSGLVEVMFTPVNIEPHMANIKFNGETVPGSPFTAIVLDGSQAYAKGPGLEVVRVGEPTRFQVAANAVGCDADLEVCITSSSGTSVPCIIAGSFNNGYTVEYVPMDAGEHTIRVKYADSEIKGSPFYPRSFDPEMVVLIDRAPFACFNKPTAFKVDATRAGVGKVAVVVQGRKSRPFVNLQNNNNLYTATFTPIESGGHEVSVFFNETPISGSPFMCNVLDEQQMRVIWESQGLRPVGQPVFLSIDSKNHFDLPLIAKVVDPLGRVVDAMQSTDGGLFELEFRPMHVGTYMINVSYGCEGVPGSPFKCETYDVDRVRVVDLTKDGCIGEDASFSVDTTEAGPGAVEVQVTCRGKSVYVAKETFHHKNRYSFKADVPCVYTIEVLFNGVPVSGSPYEYCVENPAINLSLSSGNGNCPVGVGSLVWAVLVPPAGVKINANDCDVVVIGPYDEVVLPSRKSAMPNGNIKIEYTSTFIGMHAIRASYAGQEVPGSPCLNQIFDPNIVLIEGTQRGEVGQQMVLDIRTEGAGEAELAVKVVDPNGSDHPFSIDKADQGYQVTYTPNQPGAYKVNVTYGCLNVPGCPIRQEIKAFYPVTASGEGLLKGMVGKMAYFNVDTKNQMGELVVTVRDPSGQVDSVVTPLPDGNFRVEYVPIEAGSHTIDIYFNNQIVQCTFHPKIFDPMRVCIMDSEPCWSQDDQLFVMQHQLKAIPFDLSNAGPGKLSVVIEGPDSAHIHADVITYPNGATLKFFPKLVGNYVIRVYYNDQPTRVFPIIATCQPDVVDVMLPPMMERCHVQTRGSGFEGGGGCVRMNDVQNVRADKMFSQPPDSDAESQDMLNMKMPQDQKRIQPVFIADGHAMAMKYEHEAPYVMSSQQPVSQCGDYPEPLIDPTLPPVFQPIYYENNPAYPFEVGASHLSHNVDRLRRQPDPVIIQQPLPILLVEDHKCPPHEPPSFHHDHEVYRYENHYEHQPIIIQQPPPPPQPIFIQEAPRLPPPQPIFIDCGLKEQPAPIVDENKVMLSGNGLSMVRCKEQASFVIDGRMAGPGAPGVRLTGLMEDLDVVLERIDDQVYGCSYVPIHPGSYLLTIWWSERQVPGSPIKVTVLPCCDAAQVSVRAECLASAQVNQETSLVVDCRRAGNGVLKATVQGPSRQHHCEIDDRRDGTYEVLFKAMEVGNFHINLLFDDVHVPGSPFHFKVGSTADASKVKVTGEGLKSGILATFDSSFTVDTRGAGQGQLNVKVRGKKGTFQVQMSKDPSRDRVVLCQFNPTEVGEYYVNVLWSGMHAPGSPFKVIIVDTIDELNSFQGMGGITQIGNHHGNLHDQPASSFPFYNDY